MDRFSSPYNTTAAQQAELTHLILILARCRTMGEHGDERRFSVASYRSATVYREDLDRLTTPDASATVVATIPVVSSAQLKPTIVDPPCAAQLKLRLRVGAAAIAGTFESTMWLFEGSAILNAPLSSQLVYLSLNEKARRIKWASSVNTNGQWTTARVWKMRPNLNLRALEFPCALHFTTSVDEQTRYNAFDVHSNKMRCV